MRPSVTVLLLLLTTHCLMAQNTEAPVEDGTIAGIVLNEAGEPVGHAQICLSVSIRKNETSIDCRVGTSNDGGTFAIEHLKPRTYGLFAIKPEDGYSIENQGQGKAVNITANQPYANITIHMMPKGGVLLGAVKDAVTGKPIEHPNVQYIALDGEAAGGGLGDRGNGQFRVVVPAATDVVLIVQARGYRGWIYTDPNNPSRPVLQLTPGEQKHFDIALEPLLTNPPR
jgi:hypothetical protein